MPNSPSLTDGLWLCIHLKQLSLDAVLRSLPPQQSDHQRPLIAVVDQRGSQRWITQFDQALKPLGIHHGQGLAAAYALAPQLRTLPRQPRAERQGLLQVANWACQLSSQVCLHSPDMVLVELSGSLRLLGSNWRQVIKKRVAETGYAVGLTASPTLTSARVLARAQRYILLQQISPLPPALGQLPLKHLELSADIADGLSSLGLQSLDELLKIPRDGLLRRFGKTLLGHLDQLTGTAPETLPVYQPPQQFESTLELPSEVHDTAALVFAVQRLLKELEDFLRARDQALASFELGLQYSHGETLWLKFGLLELERDAQRLLSLGQERLNQLKLQAPVRQIILRAAQLFDHAPIAADLFASSQPLNELNRLLERLRSRLGEQSVCGVSGWADYRPEKATRSWPVNEASAEGMAVSNERPVWILDQPEPLSDCPGQIVKGPERIESGWWDGSDIRRDYYVVEKPQGQRLWVYQDCRSKAWFKHGLFS
ncbi:MAG: DNA polymerase Y family protein [Lysobacterales bacterium]